MKRLTEDEKNKLMIYIKYYVTSFINPKKITTKDRDIILKCFLYKKRKEEIDKMLDSVSKLEK